MNGQLFYLCTVCGSNLAGIIKYSGVPMCCCNREMQLLQPGQGDFLRQHCIHVKWYANRVSITIGNDKGGLHSMARDHSIEWLYLHTQEHGQRKMLQPGSRPEVSFLLERVQSAVIYAYCSKHGLWQKELPSPSTCEVNG